jgi:Cu+-exporting ATPase
MGCTSEVAKSDRSTSEKPADTVKDPVCGMDIDSKKAAATATYNGKTYYFCSPEEKVEFEKNPAKFAKT